MEFLTKNPNLKKKNFFCLLGWGGGRGWGSWARVSKFFATKNPNLK